MSRPRGWTNGSESFNIKKNMGEACLFLPWVLSTSPRARYWAPSMGWKGSTYAVLTLTGYSLEPC